MLYFNWWKKPIASITRCGTYDVLFVEKKIQGYSRKFNRKFTFKLLSIVVIVLIAFSNMRFLVGRTNTLNTFDYLAMYIGAPIKLFDMFIQNPPSKVHELFGQKHSSICGLGSVHLHMIAV